MDGVRSPKFRLSLLGRFELSGPDGPLDLPHKKLAALLAYLACSAPNPQPRERLATVLWGSHFETQARQNLRQALFRLRQILGRDVLSSDGEKVFLVPGTVDCDATNLKALMREGSRDSLAAVIDLYKDRLLADVTVTEAAWADWLGDERERLERLALDTLVRLGELELQSGIPDRALAAASKAISINNLREDAHRLQIRALAAAGRRADALRHYEDVAKLLRSELDVEPDAATASLAYGLRHSQSAKAVEADPDARPSAAAPQPDSELPTGERKQITALYASLKESLELVGDPEEALRISDTVLKLMMEAVHRYEGTVSQVMGDGITALFGVPLAYEDHAVRACYAALQIQETVKRYTQAPEDARHVPVFVRVGLHSGEVAIQPTATDERLQYRVMGQTMHRADRLAQIATPGTSLLSATTLRLAEGYVRVRVLKGAKIKSVVEPAYELVGAELTQTRFGARASRGLSRFIGRDAELSLLGRIQQLADSGHGQVAAVVGEAGVGKSRFVYEVTRSYGLQGWLIVESGAASHGSGTSYLPVIELLRNYFRIQERDEPREVREKVTDKLLALDEVLKPTLPALLALLDVPMDDPGWEALDPGQRRQHTLDAVRLLFLREARRQALLLVFEDLHWTDGETQALLDGLVDSLGSARLLVLVNYRPEYRHGWGGKTHYSQLRLDALPAKHAGELLDALLGYDVGLAPLKQLLVKRANPFFLEETVRTLVETKALQGEPGCYRLIQPIQTIQVPPTVQAILAARIDRLMPQEKRLLQTASVVGKDVPFALLQAITGLSDEALRRGFHSLQAAEFVREVGLLPNLEYSFKHALTHEVTYGGLLRERRRALHAHIVDAIETLHPDRLGEHTERLAHHALRGEVWEKALRYLRQAGLKAAARSALADAKLWFEQALDVLEKLPESPSTLELGFEVRLELRPVLSQLGEFPRVLQRLQETEVLAERLNDDRRRGQVSAFTTNVHSLLGELDEAVASGTCALEIAARRDDSRLRILTTTYLQQAHYFRGDYQRVTELASANLAVLPADWTNEFFGNTAPASVFDRTWLVLSLAELGRLPRRPSTTPTHSGSRRLCITQTP